MTHACFIYLVNNSSFFPYFSLYLCKYFPNFILSPSFHLSHMFLFFLLSVFFCANKLKKLPFSVIKLKLKNYEEEIKINH